MIPQSINEAEFRYHIPDEADLIEYKNDIKQLVKKYQERLHLEQYEIEINFGLLCNVIIRVDERKDYYKYFHSTAEATMKISRSKEIALLAYWIVKYKPFRIKDIGAEEDFYWTHRCSFNEAFAAMLIASFLLGVEAVPSGFFTSNKINTMLYDLFNRDISKEAMIMYVEAFIPDGFSE